MSWNNRTTSELGTRNQEPGYLVAAEGRIGSEMTIILLRPAIGVTSERQAITIKITIMIDS